MLSTPSKGCNFTARGPTCTPSPIPGISLITMEELVGSESGCRNADAQMRNLEMLTLQGLALYLAQNEMLNKRL